MPLGAFWVLPGWPLGVYWVLPRCLLVPPAASCVPTGGFQMPQDASRSLQIIPGDSRWPQMPPDDYSWNINIVIQYDYDTEIYVFHHIRYCQLSDATLHPINFHEGAMPTIAHMTATGQQNIPIDHLLEPG